MAAEDTVVETVQQKVDEVCSKLPSRARKIVVGVVGGLLLAAGIAMLVLPGPAFVLIPAGLVVLATEFHWARHNLHRVRQFIRAARRKARDRRKRDPNSGRVEDVVARGMGMPFAEKRRPTSP